MAVTINIKNVALKGNSSLLRHAKLSDESTAVITAESVRTYDSATILEDLEIAPVLKELEKQAAALDPNSREYQELQRILRISSSDRKGLLSAFAKHLAEFSQGILQGIIVNYASGKIF